MFPSLWPRKDDELIGKRLLRWCRVFAIVFVIVAVSLAFVVPDLVDLLVGAFSLLLIYLPTILGMFIAEWRNAAAALWSSIAGVLLFVILFTLWNAKLAFAPAVVLSIVVYILVLAFTRFKSQTTDKSSNTV